MIIHDMSICTYYLITMKHLMCSNVFVAEVETQFEPIVKILRTDHGCEYLSNLFKEFCKKKGYG